MNQKAGLEIILKRCKNAKYVTGRTISMIAISMITNQNWVNKHLHAILKIFLDINISIGSLGVKNAVLLRKTLVKKDLKVYT